ncbi:MAG: S-adenosylmethionine decarboxylase [Candidatus Brocadiales bacterium]|nr:S-adenosylmethionine decarboxylase [Candidatus Bathyanammoxibius amoris]
MEFPAMFHRIMFVECVGIGDPPGDDLLAFSLSLIKAIDMTPLGDPVIRYADVGALSGTTVVAPMKESALQLHTWPEQGEGFMTLLLYSCKDYEPQKVLDMIEQAFHPAARQWKVV